MTALSPELRRKLERAAQDARNVAEVGARKALEALAVHEPDPYRHMDEAQRTHRRKLRAQAKQLGDGESQTKRGAYEIKHLVEKLAYDQWHRLLFARFLLENNLLISPEHGVSVSLDDCEELAPSLGLKDAWAVAARFAAVELPEIFRADDPAGGVELPVEDRKGLIQLVTGLPVEVFTASDSLGWCYQFWQAERKEAVNKSGSKIGADELPSVTQLFTEDYMVDFLLDNSLGAWWAGKKVISNQLSVICCPTEEDARKACALPGCSWKYLRFVKASATTDHCSLTTDYWRPAAGTFDGWPKTAAALRALDPCMGSGHFVVAMFERLVALRMAEEKLDEADAVAAVIRDNLFGLEIDPRCTQIGAFNLALAAWRRVGHCKLPAMNLACSGLAPNAKLEDWLAIVDAASSRTLKDKPERLEASSTFAPINYFRPDEPVANLTGNLPHWRQQGTTYFVTFRCADALPQEKLHQWQQELEQWQAAHPEPHDESTRQEFYERFPKRIQTWLDAGYGECVLREPALREIVESALRHFDGQRYRLAEFVVVANHVHALVTPLGENLLSDILHSWKSFTANKINEARGKSGAFWQKESFDHIVRSSASLAKFREYILSHNKVAAANVAAASSRSSSSVTASSRSPQEEERLEAAATMRLRAGMERLYRLFQKAAVLGSLINPRAGEGDLLVAAFHELQPLLEKALKVEEASSLSKSPDQSLEGSATMNVAAASSRTSEEGKSLEGSATMHEMAVTARGLAKAAEILAGQFTLVATNVPYLGRSKYDNVLQEYVNRVYPDAKADLATCFVERCLEFCSPDGVFSFVTPQNWLFLGSYKIMRRRFLESKNWIFVARLGTNAFETISGEVVNVALVSICRTDSIGGATFSGIDVSSQKSPNDKAIHLAQIPISILKQSEQIQNPDSRLTFDTINHSALLNEFATAGQGLATGDFDRFGKCFWELSKLLPGWRWFQGTVENQCLFGGCERIIFWENGKGQMKQISQNPFRGYLGWGKPGVAVNQMGTLPVSLYTGEAFDNNISVITPSDPNLLPALWSYCSSADYSKYVRQMDQKLSVTNATLVKVPFDLAHWQKVAAEKYPHGLPKPFSSDPTQWLFNGHPKVEEPSRLSSDLRQDAAATVEEPSRLCSEEKRRQDASATLQVAVARLLGYQWPRQTGSSFPDCPALGPDGLETLADDDGIVPISPAKGEAAAAERLRELLARAYGKDWTATRQEALLAQVDYAGASLEDWLRNGFFEQHCALFHHRPFIWHVWDGLKNGFSCLVNYHKLCGSGFQPLNSAQSEAGSLSHSGYSTLEKLTFAYLGDWIRRQQAAVAAEEAGSDAKLQAAQQLQAKLKLILEGEPPYDIFVRWKGLAAQAIGWNPDLNDGVRMNIRPFATAEILRKRVKIKWDKDRGKEPQREKAEYPWFWGWDEEKQDFAGGHEFTGDRWNDCHYTAEFKKKKGRK